MGYDRLGHATGRPHTRKARGFNAPLYKEAHMPSRTSLSRILMLSSALLAAGASAAPPVVTAPFTPDSGTLTVRCGLLIDGIADAPIKDATVVIRDGRVTYAGPAAGASEQGEVLDLGTHTCLPGLIDMHDHIADRPDDTRDLRIYFTRDAATQRTVAQENANITLAAGFTSVRSPGAYIAWAENDIRDRVNRGEVAGPRIQAAGIYLTIPGGGGDLLVPGVPEKDIPPHVRMGVARGPEQFAEKTRLAISNGADFIKLIASGAVLAYGGVPGAPEMTPEELRAVVQVAHAAGIKVAAHAHGAQSIKEAILAGADTIEHASLADDEAIALAAKHKVALSMDVYNGDYIATVGREQGWPEEFLRKNDETTEAQRQAFTKAWKAGAPIVYGTDAAVYPHGLNARQFRIMVERGMPAMDAIRAATSVSAHYMGWDDRVGALVPGRFGDLIAVRGNPLDDITLLENVPVVVKGGLVFKREE
jgi:imidazolonepropionase-like amidohydrolase